MKNQNQPSFNVLERFKNNEIPEEVVFLFFFLPMEWLIILSIP